jgi:rRNA maturation endonuclease Nob1
MARLALHVVCKSCAHEFDTKIRTDTRSFRRGSFAANYHTCPRCGSAETYRKMDYALYDARTGERSAETG